MPLQLFDLLSKGYFPKELPPPFTTESYAQALAGPQAAPPPGSFSSRPWFSMSCTHNLVRTGGLRRNLSIPNPKHYFRLADHIVTNWANMTTLTNASPFSFSKPVDGQPGRSISPEHRLAERAASRAHLRSTGRILLKADITRFFPSVYTHAIPWAIMGKTAAKNAHAAGTLKGSWEDRVDLLSRSLNSNQTVGIPIGPDTSLLIAEVILSRIDSELSQKFNSLRCLRFIDDYEFVFQTRSEAEEVLGYLQFLLNNFEFAINPNKTAIVELPGLLENIWTTKLRYFIFRDAGVTGQKNDLMAFFDCAFELFKGHQEEGLMKYAVARLRGIDIQEENWELLESLLMHCISIEPACLPQVCDQVVHYLSLGYPAKTGLWSVCLNNIVLEKTPLGQDSEAAWAMWLMKILDINLQDKCSQAVGDSEDSVVGLMALGLATAGLANMASLTGLQRYSQNNFLFEPQWLLCYQGNLMTCLGPGSGPVNLQTDPAFSYMEDQGVSFFDINVPVPPAIRYAVPPIYGGGGGGGY